jgi:thioredoxin 1
MSQNITDVTNDNFTTEVMESELPTLVDFWAEWCGPCKMMQPSIEKIAGKYVGKLKVCKAKIDDNNKATSKFNISSIPSIIIIDKGEVTYQCTGLKSEDSLMKEVEETLGQ